MFTHPLDPIGGLDRSLLEGGGALAVSNEEYVSNFDVVPGPRLALVFCLVRFVIKSLWVLGGMKPYGCTTNNTQQPCQFGPPASVTVFFTVFLMCCFYFGEHSVGDAGK